MTHIDPGPDQSPPTIPPERSRGHLWPIWALFHWLTWVPARFYVWLTASTGRTVAVMLALFLWTTAVIVGWAAWNMS